MDLIPEDQRDQVGMLTPQSWKSVLNEMNIFSKAQVYKEREAELRRRSNPMDITCFRTSIWDETLYKVRSLPCHNAYIEEIQ
jgi:hypothetical protein